MKISNIIKTYPLPIFALIGLILGFFFHTIWFITLIVGGTPIVYQTFKGMLKGEFASDIVAMLAIITAIIMRQEFAGAVVVLMQSGGEALETYGLKRASSSLEELLKRAPQFAIRKTKEALEKINVSDVHVEDILVVRPGDLIPVDGLILSGSAEIDESALTGEPLAKNKTINDEVFSGTVDVNGAFEMKATKISKESQYQKIVELVQTAQLEKAPIQRLADRYAIFFTPLTLVMGLIGYLYTTNPTTILSVLVVATPCPLILATPLAILCGINKSAKSGIIVKGGAPMEQIGKIEAIAFDKTGTITFGTPVVEEIIPLNHITPEELLYKTASIEQLSSHSIAKAIVEKCEEELKVPQNFKEYPGKGVTAQIDHDLFAIGSYSFLESTQGPDVFKNCLEAINQYYSLGKVLIFIAKNNLCVGILVISDKIRPNLQELTQKIRSLGVKEIMMLTGDGQKNAEVVAKASFITNYKYDLMPIQKVECIKELKKNYDPIAMVGDGINDAPALATATVGIAMGALGSAISAEAASIVLLVDDVGKVAEIIEISQRTTHIAKESIFIGMGLSIILMVIAALGHIEPAVGALLQEVVDVAVILNALRVR